MNTLIENLLSRFPSIRLLGLFSLLSGCCCVTEGKLFVEATDEGNMITENLTPRAWRG